MTTAGTHWAGELADVLALPGVTDVLINSPDDVWLERGRGLERADVSLGSAARVREIAVRLASLGSRRLDDAAPVVDARMPDGTRLHAVLPPVAEDCAYVSLRKVRREAFTMKDLVNSAMVAPALVPALDGLVASRASVLITGATGAGKTTMLATLLSQVDPAERILVIEEAGEVMPRHPHVVRLVERRANVDGAGAVGLGQLVREALRMRPDRIVLGECRGPEVREVLTALNTGHRGGFATLHANSAADAPARLIALGALAGMDARAVALHAVAAFDAVVHLVKDGSGRRVEQVGVLVGEDQEWRCVPALSAAPGGRVVAGPGWAQLRGIAGMKAVA